MVLSLHSTSDGEWLPSPREPSSSPEFYDRRKRKREMPITPLRRIRRRTTQEETPCALEKYQYMEKLGEGAYGVVYKAYSNISGKLVAIKKFKSGLWSAKEGVSPSTLREMSMLKQLNHPCLVKLEEVAFAQGKIVMVFEYVEQNLDQYIQNQKKALQPIVIKRLMYQLIRGIEYCHRQRILHRDLKPENILVGSGGALKIADFGLSIAHGVPVDKLSDPDEVVTIYYRAPELLLGKEHYTSAIDMWSVACIIAEVLTSDVLFKGLKETDQLHEIFATLGTPNEAVWPGCSSLPNWRSAFPKYQKKDWEDIIPASSGGNHECHHLLSKLLTYDPLKRLNAKYASQHPWFDEVRAEISYVWKYYRTVAAERRR